MADEKKLSKEERIWNDVSGKLFMHINEIKKTVEDYSYRDKHTSVVTDEKICTFFTDSISEAKRSLFSISDLCFTLHVGEEPIIHLTEVMRDEVDIFSDEIKIRHCHWNDIHPEFMRKIIKHDLELIRSLKKLNKDIPAIFTMILEETKKKDKPSELFWTKIRKSLLDIRKNVREMVILFKEREAICNIHPITLERTFKRIQKEIRSKI